MDYPLVSVIIPMHNACRTLQRCIESIKDNSLQSETIQVIAIDDGSTDNTFVLSKSLITKNFHAHSKAIRQTNAGACVARNNGLKLASGQWIVFLDADDFYQSNFLQEVAQLGNRECIYTANYRLFDGINMSEKQIPTGIDPLERIAQGAFTVLGAIAIPRSIASSFPWNPNLVADQDGEWLGRMAFSGIPIDFQPNLDVIYSTENVDSISKNKSLPSLMSRRLSAENILKLIANNADYQKYRRAIAQRMDLIAFTYFWKFPKQSIILKRRAKNIAGRYNHIIGGSAGSVRKIIGFYGALIVIKIFQR